MSILCLPLDVIELILLMLPVETLLSLKFVNKLFLQVISGSDFVTAQTIHSTHDAILSNYSVIVTKTRPGAVSIERISLHKLLQQPSNTFVDVIQNENAIDFYGSPSRRFQNRPSPASSDDIVVLGSANGLICIVTKNSNDFRLWNPSTGKRSKLLYFDLDAAKSFTYIGFGYDERHNDYKIVASWIDDKNNTCVSVFSLKRNSWRKVTGYEGRGRLLNADTSQFVRGKIYWVAQLPYEPWLLNKEIVSFDVENEELKIVEPPPNYFVGPFKKSLGVLDGNLCVLCCAYMYMSQWTGDLWVLKEEENGGRGRWTKLVTISNCVDGLRARHILSNGQILFDDGESFLVYDPKHADLKRIPFQQTNASFRRKILPIIHVETLVSPSRLL